MSEFLIVFDDNNGSEDVLNSSNKIKAIYKFFFLKRVIFTVLCRDHHLLEDDDSKTIHQNIHKLVL